MKPEDARVFISLAHPEYEWRAELWDYNTGAAVAARHPDGRRNGARIDDVGPSPPADVWRKLANMVVAKMPLPETP